MLRRRERRIVETRLRHLDSRSLQVKVLDGLRTLDGGQKAIVRISLGLDDDAEQLLTPKELQR